MQFQNPSRGKHGWHTSKRKETYAFKKNREACRVRDKGLCLRCELLGLFTLAQDCDHWINLAQGGTDDLSNLSMLCRPCHNIKTARESHGQTGFGQSNIIDPTTGFLLKEPTDEDFKREIERRTQAFYAAKALMF